MSLSIDKSKELTPDVYGINAYVNAVKQKFTPEVNEDTLMLGIFGYTGQMFSDLLQNSIVMASEFSNESIPTRAKFEKNIIAHALGLGITDINAIPAQFDVLLTFVEDDIIKWYNSGKTKTNKDGSWTFIFDKDTPIYIGDYCFHVDYDIELKKVKLDHSGKDNKYAYTARYLMGNDDNPDNPISDITNPYLTSPVSMHVNGMNIVFTKCTLHQVERKTIYKKVLSDNSIASKTVTFTFEGQLAAFDIDVTEGNVVTHLTPVYDGLSVENKKYPYFYYSYMDSNTIRIKFDRMSYAPRINSEVKINLQTTSGEEGNFTFDPNSYPGFSFESERFGYSNIGCEIRPVTGESAYGANKKSIDDMKALIPKESISRGSITNLTDVQNFFNMLDTEDSKLYFYKKRDNALERLYYSFIVMRDRLNTIIPTNTIDIVVDPNKLQTEEGSGKYIFGRDQLIRLGANGIGEVCDDSSTDMDYSNNFYYRIPYNFIINKDPLYGMYYLSVMDTSKFLDFSYINDKCVYQYIATSIGWMRNYITDPDSYTMSITMEQNIDDDFSAIKVNPDTGEVNEINLRCIAVIYDEEENPHRWAEGILDSFDLGANLFAFKFKFGTEDYIDSRNRIRIDTGLYDLGTKNESYAHMNNNAKCVIHILSKQDDTVVKDDAYNALNLIVPDMEGYTLSNSYTVQDGIDFFYDYSEIVNSTVIINQELVDDGSGNKNPVFTGYTVKQVPVVKYDYFTDDGKAFDFCTELIQRKNYVDYAIQVLEDAFGMDFKFFNTYGPSKLFTLDNDTDYLNSTTLTLTFNLKLKKNYDTNIINDVIADIKAYVENINDIASLHMPNLVTDITSKYSGSIVYFEFVDMNGYGPGVQHIYSMTMPDQVITPEFLNIKALPDGSPSILLNMV